MYELKKMERYLRVNVLGPGPRLMKKRIYLAAVSQRLRNTGLEQKSVNLRSTERGVLPVHTIFTTVLWNVCKKHCFHSHLSELNFVRIQ